MAEFVHLHNHSHYSLLDAICTTDGLINAALENKMNAVALTDHGVMYGAMEFYKKARAKGVKPIIGCESYIITKGSRFDKGKDYPGSSQAVSNNRTNGKTSKKGGYHHIVLLAKNETGYLNLLKLTSIAQTEGFYYKPRIDTEVLKEHSKGLIALSACAGGVVAAHLVNGDYTEARKSAEIYRDIFGTDDFYLEIQNHGTEIEKPVLEQMPKLAKELGLKLIATNDIHYIKHEHHIPHNLYLYISTDLSREREGKNLELDLRYGTDQVYFKSAEEMCELFKDFPEAIRSTIEVAEKCSLELPENTYHMPNFPIPPDSGAADLDDYLWKLAHIGLGNRIKEVTQAEKDRLRQELEVIKKMNFSGYFLIVADFVDYARSRGIVVGPGRGSAAGSLVCYALGITSVNPLDYNLFFERFLNPDRISMPDIDIDFQDDRRDEVLNYSKQKYGENAVSQIVTFNRLKTKAVLKDVGRVLNYPFDIINEITKQVPSIFGKVKSLEDCYNEIPEFKQYFDEVPERKKLLKYGIVLENLNKNISIHASGVVIAPSDITNHAPVAKAPQAENQYMTQYDMKMLEEAGLLKMDFLGLKELKILNRTVELVDKRKKIKIDLDTLKLDDPKTYEIFSSGQTIGIFQFSKPKTREYLSRLKPKNINDLAAMNALNRPGPMDLIPDFIDKKYKKKEITYLHPALEPILKETYGIIVFQEQVMQIAREVAGYSLAKADILRRAMGKKDNKLMKEQEKEFIEGAVGKGFEKKLAKEIFRLILKFADYGFNKSHSVAYSILAYYTAYLKAHHPVEFMTSLMNCRKDDMDEMVLLINESRRMKIDLSLPNINECFSEFTIDDSSADRILFGLSSIKNVGRAAVDNIVKERAESGKFESFIDFCSRVDTRLVNRKTVESLIYAGAFDVVEPNRRKLFENYEFIISRYGAKKSDPGQSSLFGGAKGKAYSAGTVIPGNYPDWSDREKLSHEKSVLGLYVSSHPLSGYEDEINKTVTLKFGDVSDLEGEKTDLSKVPSVRMCGIISNVKVKQSKKGNRFCVFNLEDFTGQGECVVFPKTYENNREILHNDSIVTVTGRAEENGNSIKLIVDDIRPLVKTAPEKKEKAFKVTIRIDSASFEPEKIYRLRSLLKDNTGLSSIVFDIFKGQNEHHMMKLENVNFNYDEYSGNVLKELFGENNVLISTSNNSN